MSWIKNVLSSLGSGIANGMSNFVGNVFTQGQQFKNNAKMMRLQQHIARENYNYQYEKESPFARVRQLRAAGLSPGLMYSGAGLSGMRATMSGGSALPMNLPGANPFASLTMDDMRATIANKDADTQSKQEDVKIKRLEQVERRLDIMMKEYDQKHQDKQWKAEYDKLVAEKDALVKSLSVSDSEISRNTSIAEYNKALTLTEDVMRGVNKRLQEMKINATWQQIQESISREYRNNADAGLAIEKATTEYELRDKLRAEREVLKEQKEKFKAEIANINADTSLTGVRKQEKISQITYNYAKSSTEVVGEIRRIIEDARGNSDKSDKEIDNLVKDITYDVAVSTLFD